MSIQRGKLLRAAGIALSLVISSQTLAGTVEVNFHGVSPGQTIKVSSNGGSSFFDTKAGVFNWERTGGDHPGSPNLGKFEAFCIELGQVTTSSLTFKTNELENAPVPGSAMGVQKSNLIRELWGRNYSTSFTEVQAAAFQLAIWEITVDSSLNVSTGLFRIFNPSLGAATLAQTWLQQLDGTGRFADLGALSNSYHQDQVYLRSNGAPPVPAPAALPAGLAPLGLVSVLRKRRKG